MKSLKLFFVASAILFSIGCVGGEKDKTVSFAQLPKQSQSFIKSHFADVEVSRVVKDMDDFSYNWDVYFSNGWELEFKKNGEWDHIDCKGSALPNSVLALLPANILSYCKTNYPNLSIVEVDKETYGYEIELSNDLTLEFNSKGNFIEAD